MSAYSSKGNGEESHSICVCGILGPSGCAHSIETSYEWQSPGTQGAVPS